MFETFETFETLETLETLEMFETLETLGYRIAYVEGILAADNGADRAPLAPSKIQRATELRYVERFPAADKPGPDQRGRKKFS